MSKSVAENNKRIAKNTIMLYIRMIAVMLVSLYTSRVVLHTLGAEDFGINNVVGGIVTMLAFMSHTMTHSAQRFFSMELGRGNFEALKKVFKVNLTIYFAIGIIVILLGETIGLWFMHNHMTIPPERMHAAEWVLHFAVISFCITMQVLPFKAAIMARENMTIIAYLSIVDVVAKLLLVFLLVVIPMDKLIALAGLHLIVHTCVHMFYVVYAHKKYSECKYGFSFDRSLFKEVLGFTGWSFYGHFAMVCRSQGINMLLNVFFGPVVNAARGIAFQVNGALARFYTNFFMAVKPQIIKYYSVGDKAQMFRLVERSSRFCFFLMMVLSLPVLMETDFILGLWLKEVPAYTPMFVKLVLINTMIESSMPGLTTAIDATGRIKRYQLLVGTILLLNFPIAWILLEMGLNPYSPMIVIIVMTILRLIVQIVEVKRLIGIRIRDFCYQALLPVIMVTVISCVFPLFLNMFMEPGWMRFIIGTFICIVGSLAAIYFIGFRGNERNTIISLMKKKLKIS